MKSKEFIIVAIILFLVFAGITFTKNWRKTQSNSSSSKETNTDSIQAFWTNYNQATRYRLHNESDSSIIAYEAALKLSPNHKDALYYIGNMYMKSGQSDKAQKAWEKLIELNPQSERAFNQLGNLYFCLSNHDYFHPEKAKSYFERAYDLNKEALNPNFHLGEIALFQNRINDAITIFNKLSLMEQKNMEINFIMGYLNWKSGREQEAMKDLEHAFEQKKAGISVKNISMEENQECDLFLNWLNNNLTQAGKYDIRIVMPDVYKKFDLHLIAMRAQLNNK
ncbi:MAG: tetratricopeptide repeat protein [Ginsengibacter sp.]